MGNNLILMVTDKDPWGEPTGGQTTFAKHLLFVYRERLAVSSHCQDKNIPIGKWIKRPFLGVPVWFFNRGLVKLAKDKKPFIPSRLSAYLNARFFMPKIREMLFQGLIIDSPEMLFASAKYSWESVCFSFAGVNNPVTNSRYPWARIFGKTYEYYFVSCLNNLNPDVIIAAADRTAIDEFFLRTSSALDRSRFHQFPTRVDTDLFYPMSTPEVRRKLDVSLTAKVFVATGRLCWIKGWELLLESLVYIKEQYADALLIFVGDGEDHEKIEKRAKELGVYNNIRITGFVPQSVVVQYMNAADVCVVASHLEGWSLAMCEMIGCGKPVVSTNVSGARNMILEGLNGYVVCDRNPAVYAEQICRSMELLNATQHSLQLAQRYAVKNLAADLTALWPVIGS